MKKEDFIHTIVNSVEGISPVLPKQELLSEIELRIASKNVVSLKTIWSVAASIIVLLSLNMMLISYSSKTNTFENHSFDPVINIKNNQLYK